MKKTGLLFVLIAFAISSCGSGGTPPTVTSTNATGKRLYPTSAISVTFSTAMDQASVEAAFQITGSGPVSGAFAWTDNTVTFTPSALWKTHHPYTITIQNTAKDAQGNNMENVYTQIFRPSINMHDVNGDGIDDIFVSAPDNDESGLDGGMAYLFLGKTAWSNIDLATQTADAQYNVEGGTDMKFGLFANIVGDINGDGFADMIASAPNADSGGADAGFIAIIYGSATPVSHSFTPADTDADILVGPVADTGLGAGVYPAGDVNGDGLADFIVAGKYLPDDFQFWLVLGRTTPYGFLQPVTNVAAASYIIKGSIGFAALPFNSCDVNGDELDDLVITSPASNGGGTARGEVYYIPGAATPAGLDLRTQAATATFTGAEDNAQLGFQILPGCDDANNDGYDDIIISSPWSNSFKGTTYLVLGSATPASINFGTGSASATYIGDAALTGMGVALSVPGDVNNDGYNDLILGAPFKALVPHDFMGEAYLFLGSAAPASVDMSSGGAAAATFIGKPPPAGMDTVFGCTKPIGDVNGDGIDDMFFNASAAPDGTSRGIIYIVFGSATPASIDFATGSANVTITGHADGDLLSVCPI